MQYIESLVNMNHDETKDNGFNCLIDTFDEKAATIMPRRRVGVEQVRAFNTAYKNISRLVERDEDKQDAKVAYLKTLEDSQLMPQRCQIVADRGKNREINATEFFLSERKVKAFS